MMARNYSLPFKSNTEIMKNETKSQPNQNLIGCEINTQRVRSVLCCAFFSLFLYFVSSFRRGIIQHTMYLAYRFTSL